MTTPKETITAAVAELRHDATMKFATTGEASELIALADALARLLPLAELSPEDLPWYLLFGGQSADGAGRGSYIGRTTSVKIAKRHHEICKANPYSVGCVIIVTKTKMETVHNNTVWPNAADALEGGSIQLPAPDKLRTLAKAVCDAAEECDSDDGRVYMVPGDDLDALADYLYHTDDALEGGGEVTTANTQPQPRTCGGCKWFEKLTETWGECKFHLPLAVPVRGVVFETHKDRDATRCPCWAAKEENYATKQ